MTIPIKDIKINDRIRQDIGDIDTLAQSIEKMGLIHPVIISEKYELLSGYRRLQACKKLGWETIQVKIVAIGDDDLKKIDWEYHENIGRKDLNVDETKRYVAKREHFIAPKFKSIWRKLFAFFKRILFFRRK